MGNLVFLVFFLASRSLAVPVEVDDNGAVLGDLFPLLDASGGDSQAGQPNLGALLGNMAAVQPGGDAQDGQPNLGDLFGMMGGLMSAMAPKEDAEEIQQQMGQISEMLGGIGLAPAGPDSADASLDSNTGSEGPTAVQQQGFLDSHDYSYDNYDYTEIERRVKSLAKGMCTGSYQEPASTAGNRKTRPNPQTKCVEFAGKVCRHEAGRWGSSWCYVDDNGSSNWGAECIPCSANETEPVASGEPENAPLRIGCAGQEDCCTPDTPCDIGEGDCDGDACCKPGLVCGNDNCDHGGPWDDHLGWDQTDDCCERSGSSSASTITFAKVPLDHEGRMATIDEVRANLDQAKGLLNEWTLAFIDGGKLCGYGYKAEPGFDPPIEIGDFLHQTHVGEKIIVVE